jgi:hypothetical protein
MFTIRRREFWRRQRAHRSEWLQVFDQHGMGSAVADGPHLSVLGSGKKFAPADMLTLQMDVSSTYDRLCADKFVYAVDHAPSASDRAKRAAEILRDWDWRMSAEVDGADD